MNTLSVPFSPECELYSELSIDDLGEIRRQSKKDKPRSRWKIRKLPGQPSIRLADSDVGQYLQHELATSDLDGMSDWLWVVSARDSSNISSLTRQIVQGRSVIITEDPGLHLVWIYDRVFIKPIPKSLLSHAFWQKYLTADPSSSDYPTVVKLNKAATGFLRSYAQLIQHHSDFALATNGDKMQRLLPKEVKFSDFVRFIEAFDGIPDEQVSLRYSYGELGLTRINFWSRVFLRRHAYYKVQGQYGAMFAQYYGPILFVFGVFGVALSAMQVALAVNPDSTWTGGWTTFAFAARGFAVFTLFLTAIVTVFFITLFLALSLRGLWYTLWDLFDKSDVKHKLSLVKKAHKHGKEAV